MIFHAFILQCNDFAIPNNQKNKMQQFFEYVYRKKLDIAKNRVGLPERKNMLVLISSKF